MIVRDSSHYHLWFVISLIYAIPIMCFLLHYINKMLLFAASMALYVIGLFFGAYHFFSTPLDSLWQLFASLWVRLRTVLFEVIPICALSFVVDYIKIRKPNLLVMTIASFIVYSFEGMLLYYINTENASSYNIFMLPTVLLLFVLVKSISIQLKYSYIIRKSSTIIYCINPLVITILGLFIKNMNSLVHFILVSIFAFMIGLGLVALSKNKKFRFLKYIRLFPRTSG